MTGAIQAAILVFLTVLCLVKGITGKSESKSEDVVSRVRTFAGSTQASTEKESVRGKRSVLGLVSAVFRVFTPKKLLDNVEADLVQADVPLKPEEMLFINLAAAALPALFAGVILQNTALAVIMAPLGAYAPLVFLKTAKTKRLRKFNDQLGDALGIMANSLRAGFSILQTMDSLSKELPPPISKEFGRALKEMRLGTPTEDALRNMADRIKSDDLELIVNAVNIQRQVGGNLAQILDNIAATINERIRIKGEIKTLTAQGRISGTIVGLLPILLMVVISLINPPYVAMLYTNPIGLVMLGTGVVSLLIGISVIRKIVNVEM